LSYEAMESVGDIW